jgi:hypothetical protein
MSVPFGSYPFDAAGVDAFTRPVFIMAQRAPTTNDIQNPGTRWQDNSVNPPIIYETSGAGNWDTGGVEPATTARYGTVILTDNNEPVATKFYADNLAIAGAPVATTTVAGIGQLATDAEAVAGTASTPALALFVTPSNLAAVFAAPPTTGGTTPAAGVFTTLESTGLFTADASATVNTSGTALNLAADADTAAVNIGTGAAARTITIGNITGATAIAINTGTGSFTVTTTGTGDIVLNSDDTMLLDADGVLELNSSAGVISIGNDADNQNINIGSAGTRTIQVGSAAATLNLFSGSGINIGTNTNQQPIVIGNQTGNTSVAIDSGTGAINIGTAIAKTITIGNVTGATAVNINAGTGGSIWTTTNATLALRSGTGAIQIGIDAAAKTITIGNVTGATAVNINTGTGGSTYTTTNGTLSFVTGTGAINVGADAAAKTITIGNVTGATSVVINSGTGAINIGTSIAKTITIGNVTGATAVDINVGTGNFDVEGATTSTYTISGTGVNTGTITVDGGTGARTINIANNTGVKTINIAGDSATSANVIKIGTGAGAQTVTLGSTNTTSTTTINSGSGNVNVTGGHLSIASVAKTLLVNGGAVTDFIGTGVLTAGTQTIANTNIATGDVIILCRTAVNASTTLGILTYTITNATSFTVTSVIVGTPGSTQTGDASSYAYFIVRPT